MNKDLFDTSFRDTDAVVSYTSLRNKALQAAEGSKVTALAFVCPRLKASQRTRAEERNSPSRPGRQCRVIAPLPGTSGQG